MLNRLTHTPLPANERGATRPRLDSYLSQNSQWRALLVHARAGHGKTHFIAAHLAGQGIPSVWYSGRNGLPGQSQVSIEKLADDAQRHLGNAKTGAIVLDDLHLVPGESGELVRTILELLPRTIRLVAISRRRFRAGLSRMRHEHGLLTIDDDDLLLSSDEMRQFIQLSGGSHIDASLLQRVHDLTDGWILPCAMLGDRLARMDTPRQTAYIEEFVQTERLDELDDFFREEVMPDLDRNDADLLIRLAGVSGITNDVVTTIESGCRETCLEEFCSDHHFVHRTEVERGVYAIHPLFRRWLLRQFLQRDKETRAATAEALASAFEKQGHATDAVEYLLSLGEQERATTLFLRHADSLYREMDLDAFRSIVELFPEAIRNTHRHLAYYYSLGMSLVQPATTSRHLLGLVPDFLAAGEFEKVANIYSTLLVAALFYHRSHSALAPLANDANRFLEEHGHAISGDSREILVALVPLGTWRAGRDLDESFETALHVEEASSRRRNQAAYICARLVLSRIYLERGQFTEAGQILKRTEAFLESHHVSSVFRSLLEFHIGDSLFYLGELNNAVSRVEEELQRCPVDFAFRYFLELNQVVYCLYQDDAGRAEMLYGMAENREIEENAYVRYFADYLMQMLIAYRSGNVQRARYFCHRLGAPENAELLQADYPYSYLALAEVHLFLSETDEAERVLEPLLAETFAANHPYPAASALALRALMADRAGDDATVRSTTERLVTIVSERQYRNLDIVDPAQLERVAQLTGTNHFASFPRLTTRTESGNGAAPPRDLHIQALGTFRFIVRGHDITGSLLASQKRAMDLLKLLVVHRDKGVVKERVYEIFWPRYSYKSARDNLNTIIYRLRKILGADADFLVTDQNTLAFKRDRLSIDVDDFESYAAHAGDAVARGDTEAARTLYARAEETYNGDFLEGELYLDFVREQREQLRTRYQEVLFALARLALSASNFGEAIDWTRQMIGCDPLCEPAYRLLMIASALSGNRSAIPRHYERLSSSLQEAFGIAPDDRTSALKEQLLSNATVEEQLWMSERLV